MFKTELCHWVFDANEIPVEKLTDPALIERALHDLAHLCDMKIIAGPLEVKGIPDNPGYSATCIVDFSHIGIHTFSDPREIFIDIFSCKSFDPEPIYQYLMKTFGVRTDHAIFAPVKWPHEYDTMLPGDECIREPCALVARNGS